MSGETTTRWARSSSGADIPAEYAAQVHEYREKLIEALAEVDEELHGEVPRGQEASTPEELRAAVRAGTLAMKHRSR